MSMGAYNLRVCKSGQGKCVNRLMRLPSIFPKTSFEIVFEDAFDFESTIFEIIINVMYKHFSNFLLLRRNIGLDVVIKTNSVLPWHLFLQFTATCPLCMCA